MEDNHKGSIFSDFAVSFLGLYTTFQKIFTIIRIFLKNEAPKALYSSHWFIVSALKINHPPKYQSPYTRSPYHHASHPLLSVISPVVGISVIKLSGVLHLHRPHTTIPPIVPYFSAIVVATAPIPSTATAASAASIAFIICGDH